MRQQRTVLILGAGASKGFGLPLGSELKQSIARDLNILFADFGMRLKSGSPDIVEGIKLLCRNSGQRDINPHRQAAVQIAGSMQLSNSIDEYVERHKDDPLKADCAKLGIAKVILEAERRSSIFVNTEAFESGLSGRGSNSWLSAVLCDISRGYTISDIDKVFQNLTIVNFNYDRCIEHFVFHWFKQMYGMGEASAAESAQRLHIFHPYGKLADLPYQNPAKNIPFGGVLNPHRLVDMANSIKTYSEAVDDSESEGFRESISQAHQVVFLGFGFHEQNLRLLSQPSFPGRGALRCYATRCGISEPRWEVFQSRIASALKVREVGGLFCQGFNGYCEDFWQEYSDLLLG